MEGAGGGKKNHGRLSKACNFHFNIEVSKSYGNYGVCFPPPKPLNKKVLFKLLFSDRVERPGRIQPNSPNYWFEPSVPVQTIWWNSCQVRRMLWVLAGRQRSLRRPSFNSDFHLLTGTAECRRDSWKQSSWSSKEAAGKLPVSALWHSRYRCPHRQSSSCFPWRLKGQSRIYIAKKGGFLFRQGGRQLRWAAAVKRRNNSPKDRIPKSSSSLTGSGCTPTPFWENTANAQCALRQAAFYHLKPKGGGFSGAVKVCDRLQSKNQAAG